MEIGQYPLVPDGGVHSNGHYNRPAYLEYCNQQQSKQEGQILFVIDNILILSGYTMRYGDD